MMASSEGLAGGQVEVGSKLCGKDDIPTTVSSSTTFRLAGMLAYDSVHLNHEVRKTHYYVRQCPTEENGKESESLRVRDNSIINSLRLAHFGCIFSIYREKSS